MNQYTDDFDEPPVPPRPAMTAADRELLELAARAIGAVRVEQAEGENWINLHFADRATIFNWNPLIHSDDSFNLIVLLQLQVDASESGCAVRLRGTPVPIAECALAEAEDKYEAARRAVTRAAAEIAKQRS